MKAMIWTKYGGPEGLSLQEVEKPVPKDNEVLIKVYAATVTAGDCEVRSLKVPFLLRLPMRMYIGFRKPERITILGQEIAGEVEAAGRDVTRFSPGEAVFGSTGFKQGAYAEYCCLPGDGGDGALVQKTAALTFQEAAALPLGGSEALHFLRQARIRPGERVLINGAGGSIGSFGVQLAKHWGAEVTAVDRTEKLEMLRAIGADHVVDYTKEDFTRQGRTYNVIFDVVGKSPYLRSLGVLEPGGRYLLANPGIPAAVLGRLPLQRGGRVVITGTASYNTEDLAFLRGLVEAGHIRIVIDRRYPLAQTADAHRYVETGQKRGNVVIIVHEHDA